MIALEHSRDTGETGKAPAGSDSIRPDFIVIGAMKCGTTTLFRHLGKHPEIGLSQDKETDFFLAEQNFARGFDWYGDQFRPGARVYGEASPNYTKCNEFPGVPARIRRHLPDAALIYMVRDPVDRFVSQYLHHMNSGEIDIPPERILDTSAGRHYLDCSRYHRQLSAYLAHFPLEHILVLCLDELQRAPAALLRRTFAFLGVDPAVEVEGLDENHNRGADLQRMPAWYFAARRLPLLRNVKQRLPAGLQQAMTARIARASGRRLPQVGDDLRSALRDALAEDAAAFRKLTDQDFAHWSV
jgi:hypothetical protein